MSYLKRLTAAVSALAIAMVSTLTFGVATAATSFTDASSIASWAVDSVNSLADAGVLSGRPDGSFDPQGQLNRAEMAKVAVLAADLTEDTTGAPHFNDVASSDWYYTFVETLYNNGVVGGVNGGALDSNGLATYNPGGTLNRAEGSKILVDAFNLETAYAGTPPNFPDVASSAWFYDYVETAYAHGIINGYDNGNFGPGDAITREQVAVIGQSSKEEAADGNKRRSNYTAGAASDATPEEEDTPVVEQGDGTLRVALSSSTPGEQTFPYGASSTAVAAYDFTATGDDVVISSLVVTRTGVGADGDWTLYLYDGNNRLTNGKTINSTTHQATFTSLGLTVDAGTTKTIKVKADTATSVTGGDSYFTVESKDAVTSNAQGVTGTFPVTGKKQQISSTVQAGGITISVNGSVTNPKVGEDNVTIAKFKLETTREAGLVEQIALLVDGTISVTDVQNAKLYQGTTELASVASANSKDLLVFNFDTPYEIEKGDSRTFEVKADLNTGRNSDTVKIYLDEATDIVAIGGTYGFGMDVTYGDYDGVTGGNTDNSESTLQGGDVTISSSGPTAKDIAVNGDDINVLDFSISSVNEVTIKKFAIALVANSGDAVDTSTTTAGGANGLVVSTTAAGTTAAYTDIKIVNRDTGATLMGPIDSNAMYPTSGTFTGATVTGDTDLDGYYYFSDEFTMSAGEELNLSLTLDVANYAGLSTAQITPYITIGTAYPEIKDINNKTVTNSASVVPGSDITGKTMTVQAASLEIALSSTPVSNTYVKGNKDVCFAGFSLSAGSASDIKITELKVDAASDADGTGWGATYLTTKDIVGSAKLMDGSTQVGSTKSMQTSDSAAYVTFDNLSYTIPAGQTKQLQVCGDISSSLTTNKKVAFAITAAGNITSEDEDGNSVDATGTANGTAFTSEPSTVMTVSQGGTLTVAIDADTPKEDIKVAGASDVVMNKIKFTTTDEGFIVKKLSINNRQSGVAAANLGDYDNNIVAVKLSYTNSAGSTETKTGYLTSGTAEFSGLDMFIDKDDDAVLTVSANLNTISGGATAGAKPELNIALNNFEAVAQGSGETYKASKLDAGTATLDIGTISYTSTGIAAGDADQTVTLGSSKAVTVLDLGVSLPVGTIVKIDSVVFILTSKYVDDATTMTGIIIDDNDGTIAADATPVYYALPGTGYLTASNLMYVYETKPTVALASDSPSGSRTTAASDGIFKFTVSADAQEKVQFRAALQQTADVAAGSELDAGDSMSTTIDETNKIQGVASNVSTYTEDVTSTTGAMFNYGSAGAFASTSYARIGFWVGFDPAAHAGTTVTEANISFICGATAVATRSQAVGTGTSDLVTADALTWFYYDIANPCAAADQYYGVALAADATVANTDKVYVDDIRFYNEKIVVDLSSDASINAAATVNGLAVYLKEGGSTVATNYLYTTTATSAASVAFIPTTAIEIAKGKAKTFTVQTNTVTLINPEAGTDDLLTPSIALGSSTDGSVSNGGVWWNDTNATVKWLGQVDNTTLNGNTLKY